MAAAYPDRDVIQTSDQEEENEKEEVKLFGSLSHLQMETGTLFTNTESNNYDNQLFEVINEHNELLHVFSPSTIICQDSAVSVNNSTSQQTDDATEENCNYDPPPVPDEMFSNSDPPPVLDEMFSNSESESSDTPDYILDSSEEEEDELVPQIRIPIKNYPNDTDHEEDFSNGWLWIEEDPGASYGPFTGNPGLNIPPSQKDPHNYFELFFDPSMYTRISSETNNYARQRIQHLTGYLLTLYSIFALLLL